MNYPYKLKAIPGDFFTCLKCIKFCNFIILQSRHYRCKDTLKKKVQHNKFVNINCTFKDVMLTFLIDKN